MGRPLDGLRKGNARLSQLRHRLDGNADQDRKAVRAKLDRHEGLQWLERAIAVQGAAPFEPDIRPRAAEACVVLVFVKPLHLLTCKPAADYDVPFRRIRLHGNLL